MNKKIFRSTFLLVVIILAASFIPVTGVMFKHFETGVNNEIRSEAYILKSLVEYDGADSLSCLTGFDKRITLIDVDGSVIFDNQVDAKTLDNHYGREEVDEAVQTGTGESERYSDTITQKTVNYALRLDDGKIIRVSATCDSSFVIFIEFLYPFIIIFIFALLLSVFLSARLSSSIVSPINNIDIINPESNVVYEELAPLFKKITEQRKIIDLQLKNAGKMQKEFSLITDNMSEGFFVIDSEAKLLTYNSSAVIFLGTDATEGESVMNLNCDEDFAEIIEKVLLGKRTERTMCFNDKNYELIANPVLEEKKVIGAVIIIIDVTEISEREALRREFTANISHELKTPLTSISGFAELMKESDMPSETVVDFSTTIYNEAQRMISLVSDIIKISELDEKTFVGEYEDVNLLDICNEVASRLKINADKKNVSLFVSGKSLCVNGVRKIIDEMVYNLCDNAIKYNKTNGKVELTVSETARHIKLSVRDTGIGIPKSCQNRVFERFYRVDKSHSRIIGGTGLGLSIVKHAANFHNAGIRLASVEGKGTAIIVSFNKN